VGDDGHPNVDKLREVNVVVLEKREETRKGRHGQELRSFELLYDSSAFEFKTPIDHRKIKH